MVSAALIVAAIIGQGQSWLVLLAAIHFFILGIMFFYFGGKNAN